MAMISIIVPVYKAEAYIRRCVNSILCQSFGDFELVLVDDGSPDNCGQICDEYAETDGRIHVIHQINGGAARARNAGIEWAMKYSDSQWLHFVDSDDWLHPRMLEYLLKAAEEYGTDISACFYQETNGVIEEDLQREPRIDLWTPERLFIDHNVLSVVPWGKLYRKETFSQIRYPENRYAEDEFTTYKVLFGCSGVAVVDARLYYYFCNDGGLSKIKWSPRRLDGLDALEEQLAFFKAEGYREAYEVIAIAYADHLLNHQRQIESSELPAEEKRQYRKLLKNRLNKALWQYGLLYMRKHRGVYVELYPQLTAAYRFLKRGIKQTRN